MSRTFAIALLSVGSLTGVDEAAEDAASAAAAPRPPSVVGSASGPLGAVFDAELLRDLPTGRDPWSLLETVEATVILDRISGGGLYSAEPGRLGVHGASWTQATYRLGDLDVTDPDRFGMPMTLPDLGAFQAFELASGRLPVEAAGAGPLLTLVPRRPGEQWHAGAEANFVPLGLQSESGSTPPAIARYDAFRSGRFHLHGPLAGGRLGLAMFGWHDQARRQERSEATLLTGRKSGLLANLLWTPSPRDEVRFLGTVESVERPDQARARFGGADVRESARFLHAQATWERRADLPWSVSAGYVHGGFEPDSGAGRTPAPVERLRDGPVPGLFPGRSRRERGALAGRVEPVVERFLGGRHALRFGVSTAWTRSVTEPPGPRLLTAEMVDGVPARVWDYGWAGPESRWRGVEIAAYAADRIHLGQASLELGLRFESTHLKATSRAIDAQTLSPRLFAHVPYGPMGFFGGLARYRHRLPLALLAYGDPAAAQGQVYRWEDRNGNRLLDSGELGALVAAAGPGGSRSSIDSGLKPAHTDEITLGVDLSLAPHWTLRLVGIHRREAQLIASVNLGAPRSSYSTILVPDISGNVQSPEDDRLLPLYDRGAASFGQDRYLLTNTTDEVLHDGVEVSLRGTVAGRLRLLLGATAPSSIGSGGNRGFTAVENDQGVIGERLENPNGSTFSRGRLFSDRSYTLKIAATYRAPHDLRLGAVARYQDGQPFSRLVVATGLAQGAEAVQAIVNGRSRFTYTMTVDGRLEKGFTLGRARAAAVVEAFNLFGKSNEVEEDVTTGDAFRAVTAVQPPRAVRLGVRLEF